MITKVWLKGKTKDEDAIEYLDCVVDIPVSCNIVRVINPTKSVDGVIEAKYLMKVIARIEFRP